ncbi:unnamed protein product [Hydatigera taeniaeformis]|uniref:FxLD family lantipeptide n=1 Tax=Hydatigena taeniaeformis TaxID=6205 RepID=A0A0R3XBY7_HYDTA|nr:unnamed protein product [Hydatigera taeniaeformis]
MTVDGDETRVCVDDENAGTGSSGDDQDVSQGRGCANCSDCHSTT